MRYRRPFTPQQRREAVREYRLLRENIRELRKDFPPVTTRERSAFRRYRDAVFEVGRLLSLRLVNANELNRRLLLATQAMAEYFQVKHFGK
jgi:hypothetical protein